MKAAKKSWMRLPRLAVSLVALTAAVFLFSGCSGFVNEAQIDSGAEISSGDVNYLSGYGDWISVQPYGQVWQPWVAIGWSPFHYGHWAWSDPDWAWVSYEPYGWLVYHYGEWGYQTGIGWFWVPGDTWSPARVQWDTWGDYCGWAPIPPDGLAWSDPWGDHDFRAWTVVRLRDFDRENVGRYRVGHIGRAPDFVSSHRYDHQPEFGVVRKIGKHPVAIVNNETKPVHMGQHEYRRMNLHADQQKIVVNHERMVRKKVLVSSDRYHRRVSNERAQQAQRTSRGHESQQHASRPEPHNSGGGHHRR